MADIYIKLGGMQSPKRQKFQEPNPELNPELNPEPKNVYRCSFCAEERDKEKETIDSTCIPCRALIRRHFCLEFTKTASAEKINAVRCKCMLCESDSAYFTEDGEPKGGHCVGCKNVVCEDCVRNEKTTLCSQCFPCLPYLCPECQTRHPNVRMGDDLCKHLWIPLFEN
jgi:hypothetical protein